MHCVVIRMNSPTFYLAQIEWKFLGMLEEFQISVVFVFLTCTTFPSTVARFYTFMARLTCSKLIRKHAIFIPWTCSCSFGDQVPPPELDPLSQPSNFKAPQ